MPDMKIADHFAAINTILADFGMANPENVASCMEGLAHLEVIRKHVEEAVQLIAEIEPLVKSHLQLRSKMQQISLLMALQDLIIRQTEPQLALLRELRQLEERRGLALPPELSARLMSINLNPSAPSSGSPFERRS